MTTSERRCSGCGVQESEGESFEIEYPGFSSFSHFWCRKCWEKRTAPRAREHLVAMARPGARALATVGLIVAYALVVAEFNECNCNCARPMRKRALLDAIGLEDA